MRRKNTRRATAARRRTIQVKVAPNIAREIWAIIYLVVGILMILSLCGTFGIIGEGFVNFLKPVFGWGIYIVPFLFMLLAVMLFFAKKVNFGPSKMVGVVCFMISVLSILHLSVPIDQILNFAKQGEHGGYTGFVTNFLLLEILGTGTVGAAIIFIALFLVSLLLIFEVSLKEIISFFVPKIKIEIAGERAVKKKKAEVFDFEEDGELDELGQPEILIHRAGLRESGSLDAKIEKIYEENEDILPTVVQSKESVNFDDELKELNVTSPDVDAEEDFEWEFPSLDLLEEGNSTVKVDEKILVEKADKIKKKLSQFGISVTMQEVNVGPTVIQYTLKPDESVKLSKITALKDDLALALAADRVRVEAPIPGKSLVGIELPNDNRATVYLRELLETSEFQKEKSKLTFPLGRDVSGKPIVASLEAMPHLLIAGSTGSGKSVCMNTFLMALLYQNSPKDLRMIMIDPKRVELTTYNNIPHLLTPVIEEPEKAAVALKWVVAEMTRRYKELSRHRVRNIFEFNDLEEVADLPRIVVVIDELADLMMVAGKEVEASICRIAQMARAVGIHLIIATQRPSVNVITGLIKANIPTRIAFAVSSSIDSRTILDSIGAEDLLGKGDMLYLPIGQNKPLRVQGIYVSTKEIARVTNRIKMNLAPDYNDAVIGRDGAAAGEGGDMDMAAANDEDDLYEQAFNLVKETRKASASLFQRRLKVGYARAARLIDLLEENGVVGPVDGAKPRKILLD